MNNEFNKLIIRISAIIFLLLGLAVVFVEYWFYYRNNASEGLALLLFTLCVFIFVIVTFILLNKKYKFLGTDKEKNSGK